MLIDPHFDPADLSLDALTDLLVDASVDGVALTPRHAPPSLELLTGLQEEGFYVFVGVKLETDRGGLLFFPESLDGFFDEDWAPKKGKVWPFDAALERCAARPGAIVASHPYDRTSRGIGDRVYTCDAICAIETRIGRGLPIRDHMADRAAGARGLGRLGASGGSERLAGRAMTVFPELAVQRDLVEALRARLCWPVEFEDRGSPRQRFQLIDEGPNEELKLRRERQEWARPAPRRGRDRDRGRARR
ncbi:MAG: hypothetical protein VYD19_03755 [Myxococcota bacterium]|nr:hypothetical protein [Myxococcota bacterium]